jgi:hypothetical protein
MKIQNYWNKNETNTNKPSKTHQQNTTDTIPYEESVAKAIRAIVDWLG